MVLLHSIYYFTGSMANTHNTSLNCFERSHAMLLGAVRSTAGWSLRVHRAGWYGSPDTERGVLRQGELSAE